MSSDPHPQDPRRQAPSPDLVPYQGQALVPYQDLEPTPGDGEPDQDQDHGQGHDQDRGQGQRPRRGRHATGPSPYTVLAAVVLVAAAVLAAGGLALQGLSGNSSARSGGPSRPTGSASGSASPAGGAGGQQTGDDIPVGAPADGVPATGAGTFGYAAASTTVHGSAGTVRKFQVAVENGAGQDLAAFAAAVDGVLSDPKGWVAGGDVRFQRVGEKTAAEFAIVLATPGTTETVCAAAGVQTRKYTSCQFQGKVVINLARWLTGVKDYGASLDVYRPYALNHEIGRALGFSNEACPGAGKPAPVMQQQTLGLHGCVANPWPYLDGQRYSGAKVP